MEGLREGRPLEHPQRLYIVSDLHLADGFNPRTRRYERLEGFYYDEEFVAFLEHCMAESAESTGSTESGEPDSSRRGAGQGAVLILNGDVFDFLSIVKLPSRRARNTRGLRVSRFEKKYGLLSSEPKALWKLDRIFAGHPRFFEALLRWLVAGHRVELIRGNHDLELFWGAVKDRLVDLMAEQANTLGFALSRDEIARRFRFQDWFYYEAGRVFVEHGHQYEESNCIPNLLHPVFPKTPFGQRDPILDYPSGSYFLEIVYNRLRVIDPIRTRIMTYEEYGRVLTRSHLLDFLVALYRNFPFFLRLAKDFQPLERRERRRIQRRHQERRAEIAAESGLELECLQALEARKARASDTTNYAIGLRLMKPIAYKLLFAVMAVVIGVGAYVALNTWLALSGAGTNGAWRVAASALVGISAFVGVFVGVIYLSRQRRDEGQGVLDAYRIAGEDVAIITGAPIVCMGHTHMADYYHSRRSGVTYVNSGTWTYLDTAVNLIKPQAQSFSFIRVVDDAAELLRWNDGAGRVEPVVLIAPDRRRLIDRLPKAE